MSTPWWRDPQSMRFRTSTISVGTAFIVAYEPRALVVVAVIALALTAFVLIAAAWLIDVFGGAIVRTSRLLGEAARSMHDRNPTLELGECLVAAVVSTLGTHGVPCPSSPKKSRPKLEGTDEPADDRPRDPCAVCLGNKAVVMSTLCGHLCVCIVCNAALGSHGRCPICRSPWRQLARVYG